MKISRLNPIFGFKNQNGCPKKNQGLSLGPRDYEENPYPEITEYSAFLW